MSHKYAVGQLIHASSPLLSNHPSGVYEVVRLVSERDGEFRYRIKSKETGSEREVEETEIRALRETEIWPAKAERIPSKAAKAERNLPKAAGGTTQKKLFGWWVLTIVLAALGGAGLMSAYRGSSNDAGFATFLGLIFGLTALALYVHKLRPRQVYLSNRAQAEGLSGAAFTE
jgi:hypothetical protein